jgi:hypothetical protein
METSMSWHFQVKTTLFISTMFLRFIAYGCEQVKEKKRKKKAIREES